MEPMNATQTHSKVRITASLSAPVFVAGDEISGKIELDCRTDKGLGISSIMVELVAVQELTSRDHSATSTFMAARRLFQGHGLPPSNAVFAHPQPGAPPLPPHYYQARKGCTTFFFNFPIPQSSPNSINFGNGLARIFYEIRASVNVFWKGERTVVRCDREVQVTECLVESRVSREPSTMVAESGKMVIQAQVVGGIGVTGRSTCVELQVKNHSAKRTAGLTLTLTRTLHLPNVGTSKNPFQLTETVVTVPFRGSEYTIGPGVEGVANLVFDIPRNARGVKGGTREMTDDGDHKHIEALFYVNNIVTLAISMGVGNKDIKIDIPLTILHPLAVPEPVFDPCRATTPLYPLEFAQAPLEPPRPQYALPPNSSGHSSPASHGTPPLQYQHTATPPGYIPYAPQISSMPSYGHPQHYIPPPQQYMVLPPTDQNYYFPPPPIMPVSGYIGRPASADPMVAHSLMGDSPMLNPPLPPAPHVVTGTDGNDVVVPAIGHSEEGKGERASRISLHLKSSARGRSASPTSHRYRMSGPPPAQMPPTPSQAPLSPASQTSLVPAPKLHSPRPMLSPKASFVGDPMGGSGQSGRVAVLEKMAAEEEEKQLKAREQANSPSSPRSPLDIPKTPPKPSGELEVAELVEILDKTLPNLPIHSQKSVRESKRAPALTSMFNLSPKAEAPPSLLREQETVQALRAADTSKSKEVEKPKAEKKAEPVTVLANLPKRVRHSLDATPTDKKEDKPVPESKARRLSNTAETSKPAGAGLDALEKRLQKEVGTRKPSAALLQQLKDIDDATDAAIREKVDGRKKKLGIDPHVKAVEGSGGATVAPSEEPEAAIHVLLNRKRRRMYDVDLTVQEDADKDKGKSPASLTKHEEEALKMRKVAKGRVAAWLGDAQEADPPPPSETRILEQAVKEAAAALGKAEEEPEASSPEEVQQVKAEIVASPDSKPKVDPSKIQLPGRRSSGFLPMSRLPVPVKPSPTEAIEAKAALKDVLPSRAALLPPPKLPSYDVRSARGGRGGKVTSVAALWAEKAKSNETEAAPVNPKVQRNGVALPAMVRLGQERIKLQTSTKPEAASTERNDSNRGDKSPEEKPTPWFRPGLTPARSAPGNLAIKATSIPAKLSSSIATPHLSSTESLARPMATRYPPKSPTEPVSPTSPRALKPTIPTRVELPTSTSEPRLSTPTRGAQATPIKSVGQTRIKDLIAKYQQGG